jgi:hypothetical protein
MRSVEVTMRMKEKRLGESEATEMLRQNLIGTLSLCDGGAPYAVQVEYLYQDDAIYIATYLEGRKVGIMAANPRAVFTVFEDRHSHPEMIRREVRCRSVMAEGSVETIYVKEVTNRKGRVYPFRLLKITIDEIGTWQCDRTTCNFAAGIDNREFIKEWIVEAAQKDNPRAAA